MIILGPGHLKQIIDSAEAAYPAECCGLLVGLEPDPGSDVWRVTRVEPSENLAPEGRNDRFEVDPRLRLRLQRELRDGPNTLIGVYHSHPGGPAQPSATDLESAWEPNLIWLITAVSEGQAIQTTAHRLVDQASRFEVIELRTVDWHADPSRPPIDVAASDMRQFP
jgi:proteasome lid subunit RPN8/RPN11